MLCYEMMAGIEVQVLILGLHVAKSISALQSVCRIASLVGSAKLLLPDLSNCCIIHGVFGGPTITDDQLEQCYVPHAIMRAKIKAGVSDILKSCVLFAGQELHVSACGTVVPCSGVSLTLFHPSRAFAGFAQLQGKPGFS